MGRAQAQATAQRTQAITNQESFQLVKCLIRVSVYHVCWMRGLFPEGSFTGHDLAQLDQLHVKMLEPNEDDDEASTLKSWVEQGVMDSVAKGYLKNMYFGIAADATATNLLEEYIYSFKYRDGGVDFEMAAHTGSKKKDKYSSKGKERARPGVDDVRYQVVRLMRMLVQLCNTLDKVPEERFLFIKLTYHDHTPEDYEPPFFHGVAEDGIGHFHRRPFSMDAGCMDTHHHMVSVRVKSVLDSCEDDDDEGLRDDEAMMDVQASQQMTAAADDEEMPAADEREGDAANAPLDASQEEEQRGAALAAAEAELSPRTAAAAADNPHLRTEEAIALLTATEDPNMLMEADTYLQEGPQHPTDSHADDTCLTGDQHQEGAGSGGPPKGEGDPNTLSAGGSGQQAYESVRRYCLGCDTVAYIDLMAQFYHLSEVQLGKVVEGLQIEGLIQPGPTKDTYVVMHQSTKAAAAAPANAPSPDPAQLPTNSEGIMAEAPGAGSGRSVAHNMQHQHQHNPHQRPQADGQMCEDDNMLTSKMSGLSVGAAAAAAAARAGAAGNKARGMAGVNASVYGTAMMAGSLMTGQPGAPTAAPTAATPQINPTAAGDEPSVQLLQDQQQSLWFDASQQSFQGPAPAPAAPGADAAATAAAAPTGNGSRLRKASYVNSPIHQHPGKRACAAGRTSSRLQQEEAVGEQEVGQQDGWDKENCGTGAGTGEGSRGHRQAEDGQQQQETAAEAAAAAAAMQPPPRRKVVPVRKPKKPAAAPAAAAAAGAPTRGSGRLAAMRG